MVLIHSGHIPGIKPTILNRGSCFLRTIQISLHYGWSINKQLSNLSLLYVISVIINNSCTEFWNRKANGARFGDLFIRVFNAHRCFRKTISLMDLRFEKCFKPF